MGYGRIVNNDNWSIASLNTFVSLKEVTAYACSKAAVGALTKSLAVEWSSLGVTVNAIAPGVFRTALNQKLLDESERGKELRMRTPMGRFGKTEELVGISPISRSDARSGLCHRRDPRRRRRLPRQRRQPVAYRVRSALRKLVTSRVVPDTLPL